MTVPFVTGVLDTSDTSGLGVNTIQDQIQTFADHKSLQAFLTGQHDSQGDAVDLASLQAQNETEQENADNQIPEGSIVETNDDQAVASEQAYAEEEHPEA